MKIEFETYIGEGRVDPVEDSGIQPVCDFDSCDIAFGTSTSFLCTDKMSVENYSGEYKKIRKWKVTLQEIEE